MGPALLRRRSCPLTREEVELAMVEYMEREAAQHGTPGPIARHMLGLRHSLPGARIWRQVWSNHLLKDRPARRCMRWQCEAMRVLRPSSKQSRARWQQQLPDQPRHPRRQRLRPTGER